MHPLACWPNGASSCTEGTLSPQQESAVEEAAVSPVRFTPGPWQRIGTDIGTADGGKLAMACVENGNARDALKRMHANAALIVESPEMYRMLKVVLQAIDDDRIGEYADRVAAMRLLIARIEVE